MIPGRERRWREWVLEAAGGVNRLCNKCWIKEREDSAVDLSAVGSKPAISITKTCRDEGGATSRERTF